MLTLLTLNDRPGDVVKFVSGQKILKALTCFIRTDSKTWLYSVSFDDKRIGLELHNIQYLKGRNFCNNFLL